jgi:hypothetical protein
MDAWKLRETRLKRLPTSIFHHHLRMVKHKDFELDMNPAIASHSAARYISKCRRQDRQLL